jgi:hypothetical protein
MLPKNALLAMLIDESRESEPARHEMPLNAVAHDES